MADEKKDVFALVFESGRAETVTTSGMGGGPMTDYWSVLEKIALTFNGSGYSSDHPKVLLRNGEPVEGRPVTLATSYVETLRRRRDHALQMAREDHWPSWMEDKNDGR